MFLLGTPDQSCCTNYISRGINAPETPVLLVSIARENQTYLVYAHIVRIMDIFRRFQSLSASIGIGCNTTNGCFNAVYVLSFYLNVK